MSATVQTKRTAGATVLVLEDEKTRRAVERTATEALERAGFTTHSLATVLAEIRGVPRRASSPLQRQ